MTPNVLLRPVVESDLRVLYEQHIDPVSAEMAAFAPRPWEPFVAHWHRMMADESVRPQTIIVDGQIAGHVVSFVRLGEREVGYWLGREYWGRGIATQALRQFLEQLEMRPLYGRVAKHNVASRRVLEKCGFTLRSDGCAMTAEEPDMLVLVLAH